MILSAAKNPKNPKRPDFAFEVSKCFAIAFGVPKDVESMEYWLGVAAEGGHNFASALVKKLKGSQTRLGQDVEAVQYGIPDVEAPGCVTHAQESRFSQISQHDQYGSYR